MRRDRLAASAPRASSAPPYPHHGWRLVWQAAPVSPTTNGSKGSPPKMLARTDYAQQFFPTVGRDQLAVTPTRLRRYRASRRVTGGSVSPTADGTPPNAVAETLTGAGTKVVGHPGESLGKFSHRSAMVTPGRRDGWGTGASQPSRLLDPAARKPAESYNELLSADSCAGHDQVTGRQG